MGWKFAIKGRRKDAEPRELAEEKSGLLRHVKSVGQLATECKDDCLEGGVPDVIKRQG